MVNELTTGCVDQPDVKCGFIGEVGSGWPLHGGFHKTALTHIFQPHSLFYFILHWSQFSIIINTDHYYHHHITTTTFLVLFLFHTSSSLNHCCFILIGGCKVSKTLLFSPQFFPLNFFLAETEPTTRHHNM
jgi:hypothetical protein